MDAQKLWRMVRTPLVLLVLVGLVALGTVWAWREILKPPQAAQPAPCVVQPIKDGKLFSQQVTVEVDNSGSKRGLAGQVATALEKQKFIVSGIGNANGISTRDVVVIGAAVDAPEVKLVAAQFPKAEVRAEPDRLADHRVQVVLGDDFAGMKKGAAAAINVDSTEICLPAMPAASPSPKAG
ncbi:LytR cell envelope-related transcriptional attenuator [Raineyella antarctica]|uniref:LytR cell envelope-related transcriptional attenuator n=1 Tax=Raineyella antarctica TaxID=1577474 RepID=A0A1G6GI03_9ACTN|nr:LytR C-terminal domain-containing protein [Raineyella antarctica]SDB80796.1 LytR cell envelope-related transcriptional attenuator [Raineyella antarctica]